MASAPPYACAAGDLCNAKQFKCSESDCAKCKNKVHAHNVCSQSWANIDESIQKHIIFDPAADQDNGSSIIGERDEICMKCINDVRSRLNEEETTGAETASRNSKQIAILELLIFFKDNEYIWKKAKERAKELELTEQEIEDHVNTFNDMDPVTTEATDVFGHHDGDMDGAAALDTDQDMEKEKKRECVMNAVQDFTKLVRAVKNGKLLFYSWNKQYPNHWRHVSFPPLNRHEVDKARCELLNELAPHLLSTLIHNSVVNMGQKAAQALLTNHLKGHHFSVGAFTPIFTGTDIHCEVNHMMRAIHGNDEEYDANNPAKRDDDEMMRLRLKDDEGKLPSEEIRDDKRYRQLLSIHRKALPSVDELKTIMTQKRFLEKLKYCKVNSIPHGSNDSSIVDYLQSLEGMPVLMPPILLDAKHIASNPHLFDGLVKKRNMFLNRKRENTAAAAAAPSTDEERWNAEAAAEAAAAANASTRSARNERGERRGNRNTVTNNSSNSNNENSNVTRGTSVVAAASNNENDTTASDDDADENAVMASVLRALTSNNDNGNNSRYDKIIKENLEGGLEAQAEALKKVVEDEIMPMLRGGQDGLEDRDHVDNLYAYCNFLMGWLNHLIKGDRFDKYYNSTQNENGRSIEIGIVIADYMRMVGVEALGAYDTPGHEYILRMKFAVPISRNMLISNGPDNAPISGSKVVIYGDEYLPCPLEVNWMEIID